MLSFKIKVFSNANYGLADKESVGNGRFCGL